MKTGDILHKYVFDPDTGDIEEKTEEVTMVCESTSTVWIRFGTSTYDLPVRKIDGDAYPAGRRIAVTTTEDDRDKAKRKIRKFLKRRMLGAFEKFEKARDAYEKARLA